jgi:uncharacterized protein
MKLAINYAIAAVILLLSFVAPVAAGPLEDGVVAFVRGDYAAAMLDFLPLAYQGDAKAQNYLGDIYYEGLGVPRSDDLAAQWYLKAAKQGYRESQTALGTMYFDGFGVPQSYPNAIQWWRKAAVQGGSRAQNSLGALYEKGIGAPMNLILAYKWYSLSAIQDPAYKSAVRAQLDRITQLMTPAQIAKAQNLAREWKPTTVRAVHLGISAITDRVALHPRIGG